MERGDERQKLLRFGMYVTPDPSQNPIDPPERFTGYHTAVDFEIFPDEENIDVPVFAVCGGPVVQKAEAEGYGGVFIQRCILEGQDVTVLYGHLKIQSIPWTVGETIHAGDRIGLLGKAQSSETSHNRKHLHLGIHRGTSIELRGYVQTESELEAFLDPLTYF